MKILIALMFCLSSCKTFAGSKLDDCVEAQTELYGDLCGEAYDDQQGIEAHFSGAKCAAESIKYCMETID